MPTLPIPIYIAHPLMGTTDFAQANGWGDPEKNVERYLHFAAWASNSGYAVISWVHHYLMHSRGLTKGDADFYLSRDKVLLQPAKRLWVAGDPRASSGVGDEIRWAREFGIPIVQFPEWMDPAWRPDPHTSFPPYPMPGQVV